MKKLLMVLLITISLLLFSCKKTESKTTFLLDDSCIFPNNKDVSSIQILDVPSKIEIGHFNTAGIKLKINYVDRSSSYVRVTESLFDESVLDEFVKPGDKYFDFIYRGNHISLKFKLVESNTPVYY